MNSGNKAQNQSSATDVRENSFGWMLKSLCSQFDKEMVQALKPHDLNLGQFAILMTLLEKDGVSQSDIGKKILMPGYATTRNIDVLEKNGLLERKKNETSRRSFCIRLTDKGKALAPTLFSIIKNINEKILLPLDKGEVESLKRLLFKIF